MNAIQTLSNLIAELSLRTTCHMTRHVAHEKRSMCCSWFAARSTTWCFEAGHVARTDTTEGQALWQPGGAEDSRFREDDRHLRQAYDGDDKEEVRYIQLSFFFSLSDFPFSCPFTCRPYVSRNPLPVHEMTETVHNNIKLLNSISVSLGIQQHGRNTYKNTDIKKYAHETTPNQTKTKSNQSRSNNNNKDDVNDGNNNCVYIGMLVEVFHLRCGIVDHHTSLWGNPDGWLGVTRLQFN